MARRLSRGHDQAETRFLAGPGRHPPGPGAPDRQRRGRRGDDGHGGRERPALARGKDRGVAHGGRHGARSRAGGLGRGRDRHRARRGFRGASRGYRREWPDGVSRPDLQIGRPRNGGVLPWRGEGQLPADPVVQQPARLRRRPDAGPGGTIAGGTHHRRHQGGILRHHPRHRPDHALRRLPGGGLRGGRPGAGKRRAGRHGLGFGHGQRGAESFGGSAAAGGRRRLHASPPAVRGAHPAVPPGHRGQAGAAHQAGRARDHRQRRNRQAAAPGPGRRRTRTHPRHHPPDIGGPLSPGLLVPEPP